MKKDTQSKAGVRASTARAAATKPWKRNTPQGESAVTEPAPMSCNISARYIDSRLKQFCLR